MRRRFRILSAISMVGETLGSRGATSVRANRLAAAAGRFALEFRAASGGGVALLTALAAPPILLVALGAIQLQAVVSDKQRTQDIADAAALWGAQQLTVTPVGAEQRTVAFADAQLEAIKANAAVSVTAVVIAPGTLQVVVLTERPSFFMNLMPLGGFHTRAEAVAEGATQSPLCVITFGNSSSDKAEITGESKLQAPLCLFHANERIEVAGSALLQAETIQTGAGSSGPMSPSASVGAPDVDDPFVSVDIEGSGGGLLQPLTCALGALLLPQTFNVSGSLAPGPHCGDVEVKNGATLTLEPGEHYFEKSFELKNKANLVGDDVVIVLGRNADLKWKDGAAVSLKGRKSGRLAGFVLTTTRDRGNEVKLDSDPITEMTGTVYIPTATLNVEGSQKTVEASDWTVMAVQALKLSNKPQVQINADYSGSDVPVPSGVGNKNGTPRLTQ